MALTTCSPRCPAFWKLRTKPGQFSHLLSSPGAKDFRFELRLYCKESVQLTLFFHFWRKTKQNKTTPKTTSQTPTVKHSKTTEETPDLPTHSVQPTSNKSYMRLFLSLPSWGSGRMHHWSWPFCLFNTCSVKTLLQQYNILEISLIIFKKWVHNT